MLRGLFEGAQYNSEAGVTRAVNLRARTKQGRGEIKEIRQSFSSVKNFVQMMLSQLELSYKHWPGYSNEET